MLRLHSHLFCMYGSFAAPFTVRFSPTASNIAGLIFLAASFSTSAVSGSMMRHYRRPKGDESVTILSDYFIIHQNFNLSAFTRKLSCRTVPAFALKIITVLRLGNPLLYTGIDFRCNVKWWWMVKSSFIDFFLSTLTAKHFNFTLIRKEVKIEKKKYLRIKDLKLWDLLWLARKWCLVIDWSILMRCAACIKAWKTGLSTDIIILTIKKDPYKNSYWIRQLFQSLLLKLSVWELRQTFPTMMNFSCSDGREAVKKG